MAILLLLEFQLTLENLEFLLVNTVIYFLLDIKTPERCLPNISSASSPVSHHQCAHLSVLTLAHLASVQTLADLYSALTHACLSSASRNALLGHLLIIASRSAHPRGSYHGYGRSFSTLQPQYACGAS
ncbi:hypothetical protein EI555_018658 [Monodon monoceros]|uniref:Uncharacterized protein n=1 Tax=Monodon monoceros TaxID=40151 RepID=A0A4V5P5L6_MONMO|nr:hypothetical protein EI555_018658 [Monodon monoceros]